MKSLTVITRARQSNFTVRLCYGTPCKWQRSIVTSTLSSILPFKRARFKPGTEQISQTKCQSLSSSPLHNALLTGFPALLKRLRASCFALVSWLTSMNHLSIIVFHYTEKFKCFLHLMHLLFLQSQKCFQAAGWDLQLVILHNCSTKDCESAFYTQSWGKSSRGVEQRRNSEAMSDVQLKAAQKGELGRIKTKQVILDRWHNARQKHEHNLSHSNKAGATNLNGGIQWPHH